MMYRTELNKRYHCASVSYTAWRRDMNKSDRPPGNIYLLCGISCRGKSWDFPAEFSIRHSGHFDIPRCEKCLEHPDYPLLILGEL